jgi:hypothetical protein
MQLLDYYTSHSALQQHMTLAGPGHTTCCAHLIVVSAVNSAQAPLPEGLEDSLLLCMTELLSKVAHAVFSQGSGPPGSHSVRVTQEGGGGPAALTAAAQVSGVGRGRGHVTATRLWGMTFVTYSRLKWSRALVVACTEVQPSAILLLSYVRMMMCST